MKAKYIDQMLSKQKLLENPKSHQGESMKHGQKKHTGGIHIRLQVEISNNKLLIRNPPALISIMPLNQHFLL